MSQSLNQMSNADLKRYISQHRNNEEAFRSALQILIDRSESSSSYLSPLKMTNPKIELEAIFREKLKHSEIGE